MLVKAAKREILGIVIRIHHDGENGLMHVALAGGAVRGFFGGRETRQ